MKESACTCTVCQRYKSLISVLGLHAWSEPFHSYCLWGLFLVSVFSWRNSWESQLNALTSELLGITNMGVGCWMLVRRNNISERIDFWTTFERIDWKTSGPKNYNWLNKFILYFNIYYDQNFYEPNNIICKYANIIFLLDLSMQLYKKKIRVILPSWIQKVLFKFE